LGEHGGNEGVVSDRRRNFGVRWRQWMADLQGPELTALISVIVVAGLVFAFGQIAEEVIEGDSLAFDRSLLLAFRNPADPSDPIGPPWLEEMARDITALGSFAVLAFVVCSVVGYLAMIRRRAAALWVIGSVLGGVALGSTLKAIFERPRPELVTHAARVFTTSFPSGHATLSAVTYLTIGALLASLHPARAIKIYCLSLATFLTIVVGMSRVYLGVHYPTDVLAGWCLGSAWAGLCWALSRRFGGLTTESI
jgi:undecaprenyl-diphosphatase